MAKAMATRQPQVKVAHMPVRRFVFICAVTVIAVLDAVVLCGRDAADGLQRSLTKMLVHHLRPDIFGADCASVEDANICLGRLRV